MADLWRLGVTIYMIAVLIWMGVMLEDLTETWKVKRLLLASGSLE